MLIQVLFLSDLHLPCLWDVKVAVDISKGPSSLSSYPRHHFNMACLMLHISASPTKWQWMLLRSSGKENGADWKPQHTACGCLSSVSSVPALPPFCRGQNRDMGSYHKAQKCPHWILRPRMKWAGMQWENTLGLFCRSNGICIRTEKSACTLK